MDDTASGRRLLPPAHDAGPLAMAFISSDGRLRACNEAFCALMGLPRERLLGLDVGRGAAGEALRAVLEQVRAGASQACVRGTAPLEGGTKRLLKISGCPITVDPGPAAGLLIAVDDVSPVACAGASRSEGEERIDAVLQVSEERLRRYGSRLIEMEESLRRSLAAELHDEIGRDLTSLGLNLSAIGAGLSPEQWERLGPRLEDAQRLVVDISRAIRGLMARLRPPVLDDYGLPAALRWHAELFSQRTGLNVCLHVADQFPRLSPAKEVTLFRIAQEALSNAAKHSGGGIITVDLGCSGGKVRLSIGDDGHGFAPPAVAGIPRDQTGWGMVIMRERSASIGGSFEVRSAPGEGACVSVEVSETLGC